MGGAFLARADDATAASWNPAGLSYLRRPEFTVVGARNSFTRVPTGAGFTRFLPDENSRFFGRGTSSAIRARTASTRGASRYTANHAQRGSI